MFRKMYTTEMGGTGKTLKKRFRAITSSKRRGIITAVSAAAALVIVCGAVWVNASLADEAKIYGQNPYNLLYPDVTHKTVREVAEENDMTLKELLAKCGLPEDMRGDTYDYAAFHMMPVKRVAEMYGTTYDELKSKWKFADSVTENTPVGEVIEELRLGDYVATGRDLDMFKKYFGLDESVNEDTKWKEIRDVYETVSYHAVWFTAGYPDVINDLSMLLAIQS